MRTEAEQIVKVLAEIVPDGGADLNPQALAHAQAIRGEIVPRLEANELTARAWQAFQQSAQAAALIPAVQLLLGVDAALAARLDAQLQAYRQAQAAGKQETRTVTASGERSVAIGGDARENEFNTGDQVDTGGGAYIGGGVTVNGGDFVGRDKIVQQATDAVALAQAFGELYARIQQLPQAQRTQARQEVATLQQEVAAQGQQVSESFVRERLRNLQRMAPDILDVVLATFANPVAGAGMVIKKIAEKMKSEAG
jgi:hypothetical protein